MPMFTDVAPFDDVNVRLALKYAINRKQLVDILLSGYGQVGNDVPITPANRFFNTEMPQHAYPKFDNRNTVFSII
jgi:peptide/nickel transport system substrate-binding protein